MLKRKVAPKSAKKSSIKKRRLRTPDDFLKRIVCLEKRQDLMTGHIENMDNFIENLSDIITDLYKIIK